ncbi:protein-disulfide reductase DsbD [Neisseria weixii]|uniref:Thiol:disulfide interchange protein DsbD n=1 Tax=Neisseria weixii TaxID=1853276 RepID=A0A3N4NG96_9NEIS|nr:protein-disulfide reductase DsbD [Neisseria weixii]ATD65007.1 protein-disulfide reductase DsbD [Neisseria weixii]RPD90479.1 protein-disulfide reductase DsbD [Neisseria weixii]RPD90579.1 protein-disulfide reductase DsbD [Neisseria weixii]
MNKLFYFVLAFHALFNTAFAGPVDASKLLPPEQAFRPQVNVTGQGINVQFQIAEGYYLYQSKIIADTVPVGVLGDTPQLSPGEEKEDEFFGRQIVYRYAAQVNWPYKQAFGQYRLTLSYQGCAEVGVCYPPVDTAFDINGNGLYEPQGGGAPVSAKERFTRPATSSDGLKSAPAKSDSRFKLSWDTLNANLLAFFLAGLGLSFTACMYPLLPIVSSIVVGDKNAGKGRAFALSMVYVQGLALTYTLVGVFAGLTGALLTVWLQQPWVVLTASAIMVILALSMFGFFNIQLPSSVQSYFQNQSNKLSGGRMASVFVMGMLSALIVGPCVAPPLAFALGYIGQTGDAVLGGLALYALALGTGVPLIIIGTFGGHIMPRAGDWMNGIKSAFGFILLAVAVYLATPYLPYALVASLYTLLLLVPAVWLLVRAGKQTGRLKSVAMVLGFLLLISGSWFGWQSYQRQTTALHHFLTLTPPSEAGQGSDHGIMFTDVAELKAAMDAALKADPSKPVLLDFYADWCVSCKGMAAYTLNQPQVHEAVDMQRFFQIDVTANTAEHQALLKEYGLFGPPGVFVIRADGTRSEALLGFVKPDAFIEWYRQNEK